VKTAKKKKPGRKSIGKSPCERVCLSLPPEDIVQLRQLAKRLTGTTNLSAAVRAMLAESKP